MMGLVAEVVIHLTFEAAPYIQPLSPNTITTSEADGWLNIYAFSTLSISPTRMR